MESISDTLWDVVICGTDLKQSLLALALSRSDKKILHIDPNPYYGGAEAALSLQEADEWAEHFAADENNLHKSFQRAAVTRSKDQDQDKDKKPNKQLGPSRSYALALAPQFLHSKSAVVQRLVSSQAYRQLEFLAVSSFYVLEKEDASATTALSRIPATREDVFASSMPTRSKRQLMKFLKMVLHDDDEDDAGSSPPWHDHADEPLDQYLATTLRLDDRLRDCVLALTLALDSAAITVAEGIARLRRHMASMGVFGPGFAAIYPKWGGCSEIAQVACRAGAVGGAVYMLGAGIASDEDGADNGVKTKKITLTTGETVQTKLLVRSAESVTSDPSQKTQRIAHLVAVIDDPLDFLFAPTVEGAPVASGAVIALPAGRPVLSDGSAPEHPIFATAHSSETGECPPGQSILYLTMLHTTNAQSALGRALESLLAAFAMSTAIGGESESESKKSGPGSATGAEGETTVAEAADDTNDVKDTKGAEDANTKETQSTPPSCLYKLYYEQTRQVPQSEAETDPEPASDVTDLRFAPLSFGLTVDDASLEDVQRAWARVLGGGEEDAFLVLESRQGNADDDDDDI